MKVGVVGLGYRLGYLMNVMRVRQPDVHFVGYVDPEPAGLAGIQKHGINPGKQYDTIEALIAAEDMDMLMIGSPNHLHLEHLRIGLESGLKLFSEKPVVVSEDETFALMDLLKKHGGPDRVMIGLVLRYAPLYLDLVAAKSAGKLGKITSIEAAEHIPPYHGAFFMRDWRRYGEYSGGFMLEKCCHDIDLYQGFVGSRARKVASFGGRRTFIPENKPTNVGVNDMEVYHRKPSGWQGSDKVFDGDGDIVDYQTSIMEFETGEAMTFHTNINVPDDFRRFCVIGSSGMAEGDFIRNFFKVHDARTGEKLTDKSYTFSGLSDHYGADEQMIDDICTHVKDGVPLPVSIVDGLTAGLTAIKLDEARRAGAVIDLTDIWARFDAYGYPGTKAV